MNEKKIKRIVNECIRKILTENTENITMDTISDMVGGYSYDNNEPNSLIDDFQMMVYDVLYHAAKKRNGEEMWLDTEYTDCNPDMIGKYIEVYRKQMNEDYTRLYNELKENQIKGNEALDYCTQQFINYQQYNKIEKYE